jgi:hypothetical protein
VNLASVLGAVVGRIVAGSPPPSLADVATAAIAVLVAVGAPAAWRRVRHGVTIVHEAGHGFAATLTRRRLAGIRLHSDTSGLTVSVGRPRGPGMVLTLAAGYPAPAAAGLAGVLAVTAGHAGAALWGALLLLAAVLVQIRNWFGLWTVLVCGVLVGAATWLLDGAWQMRIALALAGVLLLGGLRAAVELQTSRRRERGGGSDADQLARITVLPAVGWVALFTLLALAAVGAAVALLAPAIRP